MRICRNGKECARVRTRQEADRIIQQLQKIHHNVSFNVKHEGKSIPHCNDGSKPLG